MTREERKFAKSRIEYLLKICSFVFDERDNEALNMAIKALSQEPCDDAVSRDAVKELIKSGVSTDTYDDVEQVCKWIDALPSVTQSITRDYDLTLKKGRCL